MSWVDAMHAEMALDMKEWGSEILCRVWDETVARLQWEDYQALFGSAFMMHRCTFPREAYEGDGYLWVGDTRPDLDRLDELIRQVARTMPTIIEDEDGAPLPQHMQPSVPGTSKGPAWPFNYTPPVAAPTPAPKPKDPSFLPKPRVYDKDGKWVE